MPGDAQTLLRDQSDLEKLPQLYRNLLDPGLALPNTVRFVPLLRTWEDVLLALLGGVAAVVAGFAFFVLWIFARRGEQVTVSSGDSFTCFAMVGLISLLGGVLLIRSAWPKMQSVRAQREGKTLRYGVFLARDGLLSRGEISYTLVPRHMITGATMEGSAARVLYDDPNSAIKGLTLPRRLVGADGAAMAALITSWLATTT